MATTSGAFRRAPADAALMELVTRFRGVHQRSVMDAQHAAAVLVSVTRALAQQPYRTQVRPRNMPHNQGLCCSLRV